MAKYNYKKYNSISTISYSSDQAWYYLGTAFSGFSSLTLWLDYSYNTTQGLFYVGTQQVTTTQGFGNTANPSPTHIRRYVKNGPEWLEYYMNATANTTYSKGTFVADLVAEEGTYPANGRHTDGFWYVRGTLAFPIIDVNVGGVWKEAIGGGVNISGVWKNISDLWVNVGGVWKKS